jgi:hypothetical protein
VTEGTFWLKLQQEQIESLPKGVTAEEVAKERGRQM